MTIPIKRAPLIDPCVNCITYAVCKCEYAHKYNDQLKGKVLSTAYHESLYWKCSIIREYFDSPMTKEYMKVFDNDSFVKREQLLHDTFIDPKFF